MSVVQNLPQALKEAREYALLGNYDSASIYFEGSISQIVQCALYRIRASASLISLGTSVPSTTLRRRQSGLA